MNQTKFARRGAGLFLSALLVLAGCEGENLFDNEQNPFLVPRVSISAPAFAFAGDSLAILVSGEAATGARFLEVAVRGAVSADTVISVASGQLASATVFVQLPNAVTDTLVFASAQLVDAAGRRSTIRSDTVRIFGPTAPAGAPRVLSVQGADTSRVGRIYHVRAEAQGTLPIAALIFRFRGAANKTIEVPVPRATRVIADAEVTLDVNDTFVHVDVVARDVNGSVSALGGAASKNAQVFPRLTQ